MEMLRCRSACWRSSEPLGQMSHLVAAAAQERDDGNVSLVKLLPGTGGSVNCPGPPANELIDACTSCCHSGQSRRLDSAVISCRVRPRLCL